ncbi:putative niacin/nicotinamide transporter NaiP [Anoxybacillus sp. BCO1]|nr:putative niacin/nicotinamide transporter NaiP [Anoxybacillus sp. BCO1]
MSKDVSRNKLLWIAGLGWLFDAMDVGMLSFIIAALQKEWNLTAEQMGWIGSINSIGMAVGALVFGLLADRIGRKQVFIITLLLFSIGSGLSALATTLTVFLILRFLSAWDLVANCLLRQRSYRKALLHMNAGKLSFYWKAFGQVVGY